MELWIRSQDRKSLIKTTIVKYDRDYSNKAIIHGATNEDNYYTELGKYKNKERALEVLDEIQHILQPIVLWQEPKIDYDDLIHSFSNEVMVKTTQKVEYDLKQAGQIVYEMPKE